MKRNKLLLVLKIVLYPFYRLLFWYSVTGLENIPKTGGVIFSSNHISYLDPVLWIIVIRRRIRFMAKQELFKNPLLGWFLRRMDVFGVERGSGDMAAVKTAIRVVRNGEILGLYPEGTRSKDGKPGRAKTGVALIAKAAKCDVVPAAVICRGKLRPFKRIRLVVGKPVSYQEIADRAPDNSRESLRAAADYIMGQITTLWEQPS